MHKVKGLITSIKANQEASAMILPYNKRIDQYFKIIKRINQTYDKIFIQPYLYFIVQLSNLNKSIIDDIKSCKNKPDLYTSVIDIVTDAQKILKNSNQQIKSYSDQGFKAIGQECQQIKKICDNLYQKLNGHQNKEKDLLENVKKYSKSHKNFLQSVDSYKLAFQDVKLIYNIEQKTKRYKLCSTYYTAAVSQLQQINENITHLTDQRGQLKIILQKFRTKSLQFTRIVGQEIIKIPQNIIKCFIKANKELTKLFIQKSKMLKQKKARIFLEKFRLPFPNPQYFNCDIKESQSSLYPSFLINLKDMKQQHFGKCKKFLIEYYISVKQDIKQRAELNQKLKSYFSSLNSLFDKLFTTQQKDIKELINQKYIKLIQSNLGQNSKKQNSQNNGVEIKIITKQQKQQNLIKISNTIQTMVQFLDDQRELIKNMNKIYSQQTKLLINQIQDQTKNILLYKDQFKNKFYSLFMGKKQFKKDIQNLKSGQIQSLSLTQDQVKQMRQQILKKVNFIILLVNGFYQKFKTSSDKIKTLFQSFLQDFGKNFTYQQQLYEKYKLKLQYLTSIYVQNMLKMPQNFKQKYLWVDQNIIYQNLVKQNLKIKFDSQIQKVNQFKKLKKPTQNFEEKIYQNESTPKPVINSPSRKQSSQSFILPFTKNYEKFVQQNTAFQQGEKYVANFTCGLCDNIIVSGRLYITTKRLFFHSRFNSSNIFFGETKLQIPRTDIKKIEKKYNAIIFDNSISITTVNGQIFFTSFVSRDQAYDLICKTFDINLDDQVFVSQQIIQDQVIQEDTEDFNLNIQQQDDMTQSQVQQRTKLIDQMIDNDQKADEKAYQIPYLNVLNEQLKFPGLNAAKVFKIFQSGQQMPYKNKSYESFWHYFKGHIHKNQEMNIQQWQPNIFQFMNPSNLKKTAPLKFSRKIETNVPAPQTSIPFMPKFIQSIENHEIYFYSKDKYVVILKIKNSKAPYIDCFYLRYKKVIETKDQNTVKIENNLKLVFIKKPMVQGMIQSRTTQESIDNNKSMLSEMQKYLKYLQNTLIKKNNKKGQKTNDISTTDGEITIQQTNKNENQSQLLSENNELKKKLKRQSLQKQILKWGLIISVLFNIFLMLRISFCDGSKKDQNI